jgi:hypothetical protein
VLSQSGENQVQMIQVVPYRSTEYEDIVNTNHDEVIQIISENIIHHRLDGTGRVCKSKRHPQKLKDPCLVRIQVFEISVSFI